MRLARTRSLLRTTLNVPISTYSITSPMRSAYRSSNEMASDRVADAEAQQAREHHVEAEVEQHDLVRGSETQAFDRLDDEAQQGQHDDAADQLEEEIAESHAASFGLGAQRGDHAEQAIAEIGAEHEAERYR